MSKTTFVALRLLQAHTDENDDKAGLGAEYESIFCMAWAVSGQYWDAGFKDGIETGLNSFCIKPKNLICGH